MLGENSPSQSSASRFQRDLKVSFTRYNGLRAYYTGHSSVSRLAFRGVLRFWILTASATDRIAALTDNFLQTSKRRSSESAAVNKTGVGDEPNDSILLHTGVHAKAKKCPGFSFHVLDANRRTLPLGSRAVSEARTCFLTTARWSATISPEDTNSLEFFLPDIFIFVRRSAE